MNELLHGIVHGKIIHLEEDPGISDGQAVQVILRPVSPANQWGEGLRRCAGALADDPEMEAISKRIQEDRKRAAFREVPE